MRSDWRRCSDKLLISLHKLPVIQTGASNCGLPSTAECGRTPPPRLLFAPVAGWSLCGTVSAPGNERAP